MPMVLSTAGTRNPGYCTHSTIIIKVGYEYFYGFSVYLPSTWEFDGDNADILVQWKGFGGQPFIALQQKHDGLYLRTNSNPEPDFDPENSDELIKLQYPIVKNVELGRWHDFIFRAQSFTSLMADLCQDINRVSSFSRYFNGTFP